MVGVIGARVLVGGRRGRTLAFLLMLVPAVAACGAAAKPPPGPEPAAPARPAFDLQGHRGARGLKPENTLPSFETALDLRVTTLELDTHLTADGIVVVTHDPFVSSEICRLAPDAPPEARDPAHPLRPVAVSRLTLLELQSWYVCDQNPDRVRFRDQDPTPTPLAGADFRIPTLEEVFAFVQSYAASPEKPAEARERAAAVRFNIETKRVEGHPEYIGDGFDGTTPGRLEREIVRLAEAHRLTGRVTVQSFDHGSIRAVAQTWPGVEVAALTRDEAVNYDHLRTAIGAGVWSPRQDGVTRGEVLAAQQAGLRVVPWTVNEPAVMERLLEMGVDGLITDLPDVAVKLLEERGVDF